MNPNSIPKIHSGTPGLDSVLYGGLPEGHATIVSGGPGSGKTILALQFLAAGESGLYVGFEERERELRRNASTLGIDLSDVTVLDLSPSPDEFFADESYTLFPTDEVDGEALLNDISSTIQSSEIDRLVIDPLTELRALLPDDFQFRRKISSMFNALTDRGVTTLCTAQKVEGPAESDIHFLGNTIVSIDRSNDHRTLVVTKYRGSQFAHGDHTFRIHSGEGGRVYPKLVPGDHERMHDRTQFSSGVPGLDNLLHGGIQRGSVTVISGPSGAGKTTTGSAFIEAAAKRGDHSIVYLFEELRADYLNRSTEIGMSLEQLAETDILEVHEVEALTQSSDEFATHVREAVEEREVDFVMLDGIVGYRQGLRGSKSTKDLTSELHALCRYLKRMGITVILIEEVQYVMGDFKPTAHDISYLADNIIFLRYVEWDKGLQKSIGVLKKRNSDFDNTLRTLSIGSESGLSVGDAISERISILTGIEHPPIVGTTTQDTD